MVKAYALPFRPELLRWAIAGGVGTTTVLAYLNSPFGDHVIWSPGQVFLAFGLAGLVSTLIYGMLFRLIIPRLQSYSRVIQIALVLLTIAVSIFLVGNMSTWTPSIARKHYLEIVATGQANSRATGHETQILGLYQANGSAMPITDFTLIGDWLVHDGILVAPQKQSASVRWEGEVSGNAYLGFISTPASGIVHIKWDDQYQTIDLYANPRNDKLITLPVHGANTTDLGLLWQSALFSTTIINVALALLSVGLWMFVKRPTPQYKFTITSERERRNFYNLPQWFSIYLAIIICASGVAYIWIITAGTITSWPIFGGYYDALADAFLHGQLHLLIQPPRELLALPDPYDPAASHPYRLHDAVLYNGKYYIYWGPVPGIIAAFIKWATGFEILDAYLVFGFVFGIMIFSTLIITSIWRRFFAECPSWIVLLGITVAALGTPLPFLLGRAAVYEAAIAGGQFFLIGGIYWAFNALYSERIKKWSLLLAGIFWALAEGSRVSLALAIVGLTLLVIWRICHQTLRKDLIRSNLSILALFFTPLLVGAIAIGLYNYARFGSWREFGIRYVLVGGSFNVHAIADSNLTSVSYLLPNLYSYLLRPMFVTEHFPFIMARGGGDPLSFPAYITRPEIFESEPITGILIASPFTWIALALLALPILRIFKRLNITQADTQERQFLQKWTVLCLCSGLFLSMIPVLLMYGSTMRYLADGVPSLNLLATFAFLKIYQSLSHKPMLRKLYVILSVALSCISIVFGLLLSFQAGFPRLNPELFARLSSITVPSINEIIYPSFAVSASSFSDGHKLSYAFDGNSSTEWAAQGSSPTTLTIIPERAATIRSIVLLSRRTSLFEGWHRVKARLFLKDQVVSEQFFSFPDAARQQTQELEFQPTKVDKVELSFSLPVTETLNGQHVDAALVSPGYSEIAINWKWLAILP